MRDEVRARARVLLGFGLHQLRAHRADRFDHLSDTAVQFDRGQRPLADLRHGVCRYLPNLVLSLRSQSLARLRRAL